MVRLETVEDFEKVRKALKDQKSLPRAYCVRPHSYCWYCDRVNEFEAPCFTSPGEFITVKCLGCDSFFLVDDINSAFNKNNIYWGLQFSNDKLPEQFLAEAKRMNSRNMQISFFAVALEERITQEKGELRKVKDRIQEFAQLRIE